MLRKKTAFMQWVDGEMMADKDFARRVNRRMNRRVSEMRAESCGVSESVIERARLGERVLLGPRGRPVAAVVPIADFEMLRKVKA